METSESAPERPGNGSVPRGMGRWLGVGSLAGVALGILAGVAAASLLSGDGGPWLRGADATILAWTNAFRLVVPPLVVSQLYLAIAARQVDRQGAVRLGWLVPVVFAGLLILTAAATVLVTLGVMQLPLFGGISLVGAAPAPEAAVQAGASSGTSWVNALIPPNLVGAAAGDNILPLMLFTLVFALAARKLAPELQGTLERGFAAVRGATFVMVDWAMYAAPLVLFALAFRTAFTSGFTIGGVLLAFTLLSLFVHFLAIVWLYPVGVLLGGVSLGRFARAAYRPQLVAASTRSSLATVPSLLGEAETSLRIPAGIGAVVIPIAGAVLKLSRAVSSPAKFLFLAVILGIPLGFQQVVVFTATILLLSPSTPGVPRVLSGSRSLPAYVSAGIPPEYVILLGATNAVTDVLMTVLNTTGYLVAAVVVGRFAVGPAPVLGAEARLSR